MKSSKTVPPWGIESWLKWACSLPVAGPLLRHRFTKFGTVGLAGTMVNLAVLFCGQEVLFRWVTDSGIRLKASLAVAISVSTLHNYLWNRAWTWRERRRDSRAGFFIQMAQYFLACGLAIGLQYFFTLVLAVYIHYLAANVTAIALAAMMTYLLNDLWTFARHRTGRVP